MVILNIKRGDEYQFLYETSLDTKVEKVQQEVLVIFNGRLKISRICSGTYLQFFYRLRLDSFIPPRNRLQHYRLILRDLEFL